MVKKGEANQSGKNLSPALLPTRIFEVPAMKPAGFTGYDAVLSNFNLFGQQNPGAAWDGKIRAAFVDFIRTGHGWSLPVAAR